MNRTIALPYWLSGRVCTIDPDALNRLARFNVMRRIERVTGQSLNGSKPPTRTERMLGAVLRVVAPLKVLDLGPRNVESLIRGCTRRSWHGEVTSKSLHRALYLRCLRVENADLRARLLGDLAAVFGS